MSLPTWGSKAHFLMESFLKAGKPYGLEQVFSLLPQLQGFVVVVVLTLRFSVWTCQIRPGLDQPCFRCCLLVCGCSCSLPARNNHLCRRAFAKKHCPILHGNCSLLLLMINICVAVLVCSPNTSPSFQLQACLHAGARLLDVCPLEMFARSALDDRVMGSGLFTSLVLFMLPLCFSMFIF